jgi:hypothetical protein
VRARFDPILPRQPGWPRIAIAASVLLHILLFLGPVESRLPDFRKRPDQVVVLPPSTTPERTRSSMTYQSPRDQPATAGVRLPTPGGRGTGRPGPAIPALRPPLAPQVEPPAADSAAPSVAERRARGRVGPEYGTGVLWVRPVPISPEQLAKRLEEEHFEHVDSAVVAIMQAFLDSLDQEPGSGEARLPEWTTNVGGSKFGLDSRYIYIAGLKIPAAVLALLPLPQGNIDQARAYNHLMDLRADIERAARRADNMDEFKRAIRDIRERKQRERDFERAQRETPPPPPKDPPTP